VLIRHKGAVIVYACLLACLVFVVATVAQQGRPAAPPPPAPPPPAAQPLVLKNVVLPTMSLPASPTGGSPSNGYLELDSSSAPFCIVGLHVNAQVPVTGPNQAGDIWIYLEYLDGIGAAYPHFTLFNGEMPASSPLDLIVSQGSQVCAYQSVQYHATMWQPSQAGSGGPGVPATITGNAIVWTQADNTVTAVVHY